MSAPRFLADENLRHTIIAATQRFDPLLEFATVAELGLSGTADSELLEFANANGWLLVSHDVNTMRQVAEDRLAAGLGMKGLFLAPQHHPAKTIAANLQLIWGASQAEEWDGQVVFLPQ